jgi:type VI secretion system protein ImpM
LHGVRSCDPEISGLAVTEGARVGLFGKLPARGDFVRIGLPGSFIEPWDAWLQRGIDAARRTMGERWLPAWLEAPVWRFALPPGACGQEAVLGLMIPSVDRVGRYFPLTMAATYPADRTVPGGAAADVWLDACEAAGRMALEQDATPAQVVACLPAPEYGTVAPDDYALWWTAGGPLVAATRFSLPGLPDPAGFAAMIDDNERTESPT